MTTPKRPSRPRRKTAAAAKTEPTEEAATPKAKRGRRARQGSVAMTEATPQVARTGRGEPTTKVPPGPAYVLVFNRERWDIIGGRLCPVLSRAKYMPGANGVGADRAGRPIIGMMLAQITENGHTIIPHDVDGPGTSYLVRDPDTGGWFSRWESVFPNSMRVHSDTVRYAEWCVSLIDRGVIEPCPIHVLEELRSRYGRMLGDTRGKPEQLDEHNKYAEAVRQIDAEIEAAQAEADEEEAFSHTEPPKPLDAATPDVSDEELATDG